MCNKCGHEELVKKIDKLMQNELYKFAEETLSGIMQWVDSKLHCTIGQKNAVKNIAKSKEKEETGLKRFDELEKEELQEEDLDVEIF